MRPHEAYDDNKRAELFKIAEENSPKAYALVQLLYKGALRIQDVIGIPFSKITQAIPDAGGFIEVKFEAKKTTSRVVVFSPDVVDAVEAYRQHEDQPHDAVIFTSDGAITSSKTLQKWLTRFFGKHKKIVKSHDFRTTMATNHYKEFGNVKKTQLFLGHSSVAVTDGYLKPDEKEIRKE